MVPRYNHALYVEQDFIYIIGLTLRHYGQGGFAKAIYIRDGSDNLVNGCTFAVNDLGISLNYTQGGM